MTELNISDNTTGEFNRVVQVSDGGRGFNNWLRANLSDDELKEWYRVQSIHEKCIDDAVSAGDAKRIHYQNGQSEIHWKNDTVHKKWIYDTPDHIKYIEFWDRYFESLK